jgi:hypothetical protein
LPLAAIAVAPTVSLNLPYCTAESTMPYSVSVDCAQAVECAAAASAATANPFRRHERAHAPFFRHFFV